MGRHAGAAAPSAVPPLRPPAGAENLGRGRGASRPPPRCASAFSASANSAATRRASCETLGFDVAGWSPIAQVPAGPRELSRPCGARRAARAHRHPRLPAAADAGYPRPAERLAVRQTRARRPARAVPDQRRTRRLAGRGRHRRRARRRRPEGRLARRVRDRTACPRRRRSGPTRTSTSARTTPRSLRPRRSRGTSPSRFSPSSAASRCAMSSIGRGGISPN